MPVQTWRVELDRTSDVPLYQQIANLLRADIEHGVYPPGSVIPSVKTIEQETGCTHVTVRKGIDILEDEGLVIVRPGKGTYVTRRDNGQ
jgi:DNA-binding GntR family transcriptional regulator